MADPIIFEQRIASSLDDVEERASGTLNFGSSDLELVDDAPGRIGQIIGLRFTGVSIPQGAIISAAYIQLQVDEASAGPAALAISAEASDDAAAFAAISGNVSSRTTTNATVSWSPEAWTTVGAAGLDQRTSDLSAIVQEIVNRSGWTANNAMVFSITGSGTRTAEAFDGAAGAAPTLHIEFLPPPPLGDPVVFDAPPDADTGANQISETAVQGTPVGITASASDLDAGQTSDTVTYTIDDPRFAIDPDTGVVSRSNAGTFDFESEPSATINVTATSSDGSVATQAFALSVLDGPEPAAFNNPPDGDAGPNRIAESASAATLVGITASASDPDAGDTIAFSLDNPRFAIASDGRIMRSATGTLNATSEPIVTLNVTATSSDFSTATQVFTLSILDGSASAVTVEKRIGASADDAEERPTGSVNLVGTDLELVDDPPSRNDQSVGLRFTDLAIPQGAIITSAYIQFQADEVSTGPASLVIAGQDVDNALAFVATRGNVSTRTTTSNTVTWAPADWSAAGAAGPAQRTADLSSIVQEIVDRPGWAPTQAMAFTIAGSGTRTAEAFDGVAAVAPLLHVEYLPPPPASAPVEFDTPPDSNAAANTASEAAVAGTPVGIRAAATDPDAQDTVTYTANDARFVIDPVTGDVTRSSFGLLDFESEPAVVITVTATSSDRSTASQTFAVDIANADELPLARGDAALTNSQTSVVIDVLANDDPGDTPALITQVAGATGSVEIDQANSRLIYTPAAGFTGIDTFGYTIADNNGDLSSATVTITVGSAQPPTSLTYIRTIDASQWSPPSPDSSGIAYIAHLDTMIVSDGEVDEIPTLFTGDNLFEMNRVTGGLENSLSTTAFSDEPTGVAYNPTNHHLYFTDDTGTRRIYELDPGTDGLYGTTDDAVTSFRTSPFGSADPEGIAYDTTRGDLYVVDGAGNRLYTISAGANGIFDGVPSDNGDDQVTSLDLAALGLVDPEGVAYDAVYDLLYVTASRTTVAQITPSGTMFGLLDISAASARAPAGLEIAPSSVDPSKTSLFIVDRGVDNDSDPNENDGLVYEFSLDPLLLS